MQNNLDNFKNLISKSRLDGFIVTNPYNIYYLTNFKGISPTERESILVFSPNPTLVTATLYKNEAEKVESKNLQIKIARERNEIENHISKLLGKNKAVGFEEKNLTVSELKHFKKLAKKAKFKGHKSLVENLRIIKSKEELEKIEKAQVISQKAYEKIIKLIKIGQTELEIAHTLKSIITSLGANDLSFDSIIASGPNSGIPHHITGNRKLQKGDTLLLDFGAKYENYCADLSRTVFIGKPSNQQANTFNHVLSAQKKAVDLIKDKVKSHEPFHAANNHFIENNLDKYFLHGLGHGIGLEVHEPPYLRSSSDNTVLKAGMVFSVEPGLYFNWGGVRIEDLITLENNKAKVFGKLMSSIVSL